MKRAITLLIISGCLTGCARKISSTDNFLRNGEIEALIEKLAIADEPDGNSSIYTPSSDTPRTDKRVVASDAATEIKKYGKRAFPYLVKHLNDKRQSVAFRRVIPHDVADACFCIIRDQVFLLPGDYRGSFYRTGADGKQHGRPYFLKSALFDYDTVESWLEERKDKSLVEIQIEALQWLIEQEKHIGFQNNKDKREFLYPLERQLKKLKKRKIRS